MLFMVYVFLHAFVLKLLYPRILFQSTSLLGQVSGEIRGHNILGRQISPFHLAQF